MDNANSQSKGSFVGKMFDPSTIVMALLLGIMSWGGMQIVGLKEVQASIVTQQASDDNKIELIYNSVQEVSNTVIKISTDQTNMNEKVDNLESTLDTVREDLSDVRATNTHYKKLTTALIRKYDSEMIIVGEE